MRRQEQRVADDLRRQQDEQAEVLRLQEAAAEERRLQQQADADEVLRLQAAADELAAQAIIDAEIAATLLLADELFRAEARARQRLADDAEFHATSASWAAEQLALSQLDQDRSESASASALAAAQTALEQQAAEQTLILHATHKGKSPAVAGPVSNNSWAIRNGGRGISGIVAANGPVSVAYGVAVATDIGAVCTLPVDPAGARLMCCTTQADNARKRRAVCELDNDVSTPSFLPEHG